MRIAVCDDDFFDLELICKNLKFVLKELAIAAEVTCFSDGGELLKSIRGVGSYQLYVLDIMFQERQMGSADTGNRKFLR